MDLPHYCYQKADLLIGSLKWCKLFKFQNVLRINKNQKIPVKYPPDCFKFLNYFTTQFYHVKYQKYVGCCLLAPPTSYCVWRNLPLCRKGYFSFFFQKWFYIQYSVQYFVQLNQSPLLSNQKLNQTQILRTFWQTSFSKVHILLANPYTNINVCILYSDISKNIILTNVNNNYWLSSVYILNLGAGMGNAIETLSNDICSNYFSKSLQRYDDVNST